MVEKIQGMRLREYLLRARKELPSGPDYNPQLEAEVLVRKGLSISREQIFAELERLLTPNETATLDALIARRASGEPLAYITQHREFYSLDIAVNEHVLIPRQESELLVDMALDFANGLSVDTIAIADVGTGSGALAVALAHNLPKATLKAIDLSAEALHVADNNARRYGVSNRISLLPGDLLEPISHAVDIIVSNPPYIPTEDINGLPTEVGHEPRQALDGGPDGLHLLRRLLAQAPAKLKRGGCMLVELSPEQMDDAERMAQAAFPSARVSHAHDLLGLARVLIIKTK